MELSPVQIVQTLTGIGRALDEKADEVEQLDAAWVTAKGDYRRAYAKAFLTAEGSMDIRRYTAELQTDTEFLAVETAEQVLRAGKESLRVLRDRLEIGRSLGALVRAEASL